MNEAGRTGVLLVEDNPTDAELCIHVLQEHRLGNPVAWVKDGAEALDYLHRRGAYAGAGAGWSPPRIVLLDLRLPKVDGIEVLRAMKSDERLRTLPVVVVTSSREDRDLVESYQLGVNSYVQKPVKFDEFARSVANLGFYWLIENKVPG